MTRIAITILMSYSLVLLQSCKDDPLVGEKEIIGDTLPTALTTTPGNVSSGKFLFMDRNGGHCVLCHAIDGLDVQFQGNVGPDLSQVAKRLSPAQIRLRLVDYQRIKSGTVMPSYYRVENFHQVAPEYDNLPVLDAQQIEDLVSYLSTLGVSS